MILLQTTSTVVEKDAAYLVPQLRDLAFSVDIRYPHYITCSCDTTFPCNDDLTMLVLTIYEKYTTPFDYSLLLNAGKAENSFCFFFADCNTI